jgi:hypothetical protein
MKAVKEKQSKDEPIILYRNGPEIDSLRHDLETLLPYAQRLVEAYTRLPFCNESESFYSICANTSVNANAYLFKTVPNAVKVEGAEFDREQAIKLGLFKCPGLIAFENALVDFKAQQGEKYIPYYCHKNGTCEVDSATWNAFEKRHMVSVDTPEAKELYNKLENYLKITQNFHDYMRANYNVLVLVRPLGPANVAQFATLDNEGKLKINHSNFAALIKHKVQSKTEKG